MDKMDVKRQMMKLWKDTFHDSDEYISMIFDSYYNEDLVEYEVENGRVISALLAIPYKFSLSEKYVDNVNNYLDSRNHFMHGLYLCGLATDIQSRGRGIMSKLINNINKKGYKYGYDFTFLIPASKSLQTYYRDKNYVSCFKRIPNRYVKHYNFKKLLSKDGVFNDKYKNVAIIDIDLKEQFENLVKEKLGNADGFFNNFKSLINVTNDVNIMHDDLMIINIINDAIISSGKVILAIDKSENLIGFTSIVLDENSECIVPHVYSKSDYIKYQILDYISNIYPDKEIVEYEFVDECKRIGVWSPGFTAYSEKIVSAPAEYGSEEEYSVNNHPEIYGMARILNASEILKFAAKVSVGSKFSILVKDENPDYKRVYVSKNGDLKILKVLKMDDSNIQVEDEETGEEHLMRRDKILELSTTELGEILWRNPETPDYAGVAFDLPRLSFNMAYMLD
ncbi:MAG: hypothetical protein HDS73_01815 [Bacteroidales bacterium]|nr:hypothetical protein [Bacteroidales bacterium]